MTREEIADKFEELAKGIREGKTIQSYYTHWGDIKEHMLDDELRIENLRIKPEPTYVPFTADDWKEFKKESLFFDGNRSKLWQVESWSDTGIWLGTFSPFTYVDAFKRLTFSHTLKPFGKQVQP